MRPRNKRRLAGAIAGTAIAGIVGPFGQATAASFSDSSSTQISSIKAGGYGQVGKCYLIFVEVNCVTGLPVFNLFSSAPPQFSFDDSLSEDPDTTETPETTAPETPTETTPPSETPTETPPPSEDPPPSETPETPETPVDPSAPAEGEQP